MKKVLYHVKSSYGYNPEHKGAPYVVNGKSCNAGNLFECVAHEWAENDFSYDTKAVPFDKGSDIESLNMSVKSSGASLACLYGDNMIDILTEYFNRVHSTSWAYVVKLDDEFVLYIMNAVEFKEFLESWAGLTRESGQEIRYKVRIKKTSGKMLSWLDERVGEQPTGFAMPSFY